MLWFDTFIYPERQFERNVSSYIDASVVLLLLNELPLSIVFHLQHTHTYKKMQMPKKALLLFVIKAVHAVADNVSLFHSGYAFFLIADQS